MNAEVLDFSMSNENKNLALEGAISQIEKNFGKGSVMKLGENDQNIDIQSISTGSLGLDIALGIGGFPKGRIIEIYGPESSGKTTLALHAIAEAQKQGGSCAFVDAEHALDPVYAKKLGVNIDELLISQPDAGEQAFLANQKFWIDADQKLGVDYLYALMKPVFATDADYMLVLLDKSRFDYHKNWEDRMEKRFSDKDFQENYEKIEKSPVSSIVEEWNLNLLEEYIY